MGWKWSTVLRLGPENKDEYIIGKFHKCSLPLGGLVHVVVNKIWGISCKISCKKFGDSSFMFHIPHQPTRQWVIQRGVSHIDDCLLFVLPWTPEGSFKISEISTFPLWVTLKNIPDCCYSRLGISHVASGLGESILTHKPRLDPTSMGEAKVLVEMELDKDFPKLIGLDDKQGNIFLVNVDYTWIPSMCERCGNLGHKAKICILTSKPLHDTRLMSTKDGSNDVIPVVDIDPILKQREKDPSTEAFSQKNPMANGTFLTSTPASEAPLSQATHVVSSTEINPHLPSGSEIVHPPLIFSTDISMECQDTSPARCITHSPSQPQQEKTTALKFVQHFIPIIVDPLTTTPQAGAFESPSCFTVLGVVDEADTTRKQQGF
ncbi:hypothetical protein F2Q68_00002712 [Brassica cretica]|uniref:DUF4283 domain-containing protein n=1 Tax=Brassica cretica TaxID=69181 RepID=A0A8S9JJ33_BRACR|nr:hypothetical protein F2Q68_00002712 [Brassica cretica]